MLEKFRCWLVRSMVLIYSPADSNMYGSRLYGLRGQGRCRGGVKSCRSVLLWGASYSLVQTLAVGCIV